MSDYHLRQSAGRNVDDHQKTAEPTNEGQARRRIWRKHRHQPDATKYSAFISYSRALDEPIAIAVQAGLHQLAKPWYRPRSLRVFRDEGSLSANPDLWKSIAESLQASEFFILLASPQAASSVWVGREIDYWITCKPIENLLIVLTEGSLDWDSDAHHFRFPETTALPKSLGRRLSGEPRYVDLRWARAESLSLTHPRFRDAIADLAAPLHHKPKDDLIGEDIRQYKRTVRWRNSAVTSLVLLTVLAVVAAFFAVVQRNTARTERDTANSRSLAAASLDAVQTQQLDLALLLAVESHKFRDTRQSRDSLLNGLMAEPELKKYLHGHPRPVTALATDGNTIASADEAGEVRRWNLEVGTSNVISAPVEPAPFTLSFSPDGRTLAYINEEKVVVRSISSGQEFLFDGASTGVRFSADGRSLASFQADGVVVWDLTSRRVLMERRADVANAAFDSNGARLAVSASDGHITVFDLRSGEQQELQPLTDFPARGLTFSPRGDSLFASSGDRAIIAWDLTNGRGTYLRPADPTIGEFNGLLSDVYPLAVNEDSTLLAAGDKNGSVMLWDLPQPGRSRVLGGGGGSAVTSVAFSGSQRLLTGSATGSIAVRQLGDPPPLAQPLTAPVSIVSATALDASNNTAAAAGCASGYLQEGPEGSFECTKGATAVWSPLNSPEARSTPRILHGHSNFVSSTAFVGASKLLTSGQDGEVILWDLSTGQEQVIHTDKHATKIAVKPNGTHVALANFYGELSVMDLATRERSILAAGADGGTHATPVPITSLAFSPDGRTLATGDHAGSVKLWNLETMTPQVLAAETGQTDSDILGIAFSPDGNALAAAGRQGTITRWSPRTGDSIGLPLIARDISGAVAFSPDGRTLASATHRGIVYWDAVDGLPLSRALGNGSSWDSSITFGSGTRPTILYGGGDAVMLWDASTDSWSSKPAQEPTATSPRRNGIDLSGSETPYRATCAEPDRPSDLINLPVGQNPASAANPPTLTANIAGTLSFAQVLDSCTGLRNCRQIEEGLNRGGMDRVEGCAGNMPCRYVFNGTGFAVPLSFNGTEWLGQVELPPYMSFTCDGQPRPTRLRISLQVLTAQMQDGEWSANQVRLTMEHAAGRGGGGDPICPDSSTVSSAIATRR